MQIIEGLEIIDLALCAKKDNALIIADLHLGYEEAMNEQGTLLPRFNYKEISSRLIRKVFAKRKNFRKIIINGDLKHEFGRTSHQEWKEVTDMIALLEKHCREIILVQGNHDNMLGPIRQNKKIKILKDGFLLENSKVYVLHGNRVADNEEFKKAKILVIGHEHPAISVSDGIKTEKYKCFLRGKWKEKDAKHGGKLENKILIVQPSMCAVFIGTDVLKEKMLSPFLKQDLSDFEVFAVEDTVYDFGKIKEFK